MSKRPIGQIPDFARANLPALFMDQVKRSPEAIALECGSIKLSYAELWQRSSALARQLVRRGVQQEEKVAISLHRSPEMIIGILAIMQAGAAYVPVDPGYPQERIDYLLQDSGANLLLTQERLVDQFKAHFSGKIMAIDQPLPEAKSQIDLPELTSDQLAYMIYTSGSTGQPKGVMIEHSALANCITAHQQSLDFAIQRFLFAYSFSFDGSVLLIWLTLCSGGTLVIAPESLEKDLHQLTDFIQEKKINHLLTFPSLYSLILNDQHNHKLNSLQTVSVAGEACPGALVKLHFKYLPQVRLFNEYGPTEATVGTTVFEAKAEHQGDKTPIGKCVDGTHIVLLDKNNLPIDTDTIGEIGIMGKGLARGYFNRPHLTTEKFIPHPSDPSQRIYKTGDLARWLPDGNLDFIGRKDTQVKLRGYRIELGEVEATLRSIPEIKEAVVLLKGEQAKDQQLVAYVQTRNEKNVQLAKWKKYLGEKIPEYMIPARFIQMMEFPVAPSGKIDRDALPEPNQERPNLESVYKAPHSEVEKYLCQLWEKSLGIRPIGIDDKFFELGGNSLQAAGFISHLQQLFDETIFIVTIFEHPTIAQYAAMLARDYRSAVERHFGDSKGTFSTDSSTSVLVSREIKAFVNTVPQRQTPLGAQGVSPDQLEKHSDSDPNPSAIFILAPPRSGTSLLRVMLGGHPQIFAANELQLLHFNNMQERANAYAGKFSLWKEGLIRTVMELQSMDVDAAKSLIQDWEKENVSTAFVFGQLQKWTGAQRLLDKSPSYALDLPALRIAQKEFKNPRFIHLSRNPFAMIDSFDRMHMDQVMYLNNNKFKGKKLGELIWQQSHANINQFFSEIPNEQQIHLTYESLIRNPEQATKKLCEFLNIPFDPACLNPYQDLENKMTDGIYADSKPMGDVNFFKHGKIEAALAEKWKKAAKNIQLSEPTKMLAQQLGHETDSTPKSKPNQAEESQDIAIIGMQVRLPGAANVDEFWENLKSGIDVSREFSEEEILAAGIDPTEMQDPGYVNRGMVLDDYDKFDAPYFGYLPKEAALMDPQHRVFLEVAHSALENAAINPQTYPGKIGIYGGIARNTYLVNNVMTHPQYFQSLDDFQIGIALEKDFPATRVAYKLNLNGPALHVQTACSSSGVAVHLACQSLRAGDAEVMLVGGGRIQPPVDSGYLHTDGHALSPTGYCHTFDAEAQGMVRGQGMVCIVLKKLSKALADGDNIRGIIKGSAINNDGSDKIGFTAPSTNGQAEAIKAALTNAGVSPTDISYVEAHGTGTSLGDPIEIAGLTKAYRQFTPKKQFCAIASVKTNIGHLDAGSCLAGMVKTILAMQHEMLPANLRYKSPNPQIDFANSPFYVNAQMTPWPRTEKPRLAGISSLGLGGTNAHIILKEAPLLAKDKEILPSRSSVIIPLSAKREEALDLLQKELLAHWKNNEKLDLASIAATHQIGRQEHAFRRALVVPLDASSDDFAQKRFSCEAQAQATAPIVFMFPGGGSQYVNMGRQLFAEEPVFKEHLEECLAILKNEFDLELINILYPENNFASVPIENPLHGITLLFAVEYATAQLWMSWGVQPTVMLGHSLGEYTAACLAGVFTLREALAMVYTRGKLFTTLPKGGMLSIALPPHEVRILIGDRLDFAAINHPGHCVVSGSEEAIDEVKRELNELEIHATRPKINVAAHSREIEPILEQFKQILINIDYQAPRLKLISNVQGDWAKGEDMQSPEYWLNHLRQTVLFGQGLDKVFDQYNTAALIEVGPGQTLATFARQHKNKPTDLQILASIRHPKENIGDTQFVSQTLARLWANGLTMDWTAYHENRPIELVALPTYPFAKEKHWIASKIQTQVPPNLTNQQIMKVTQAANDAGDGEQASRATYFMQKLKKILQEMSGIAPEKMDASMTFLEMGFDSLFLTQAVAKIKKEFKVKLTFRQLFDEYSNLNKLAAFLDQELPAEQFANEWKQERAAQQPPISTSEVPTNISAPNLQPPSFNFSTPPAGSTPEIQQIIQQQLRLMEQQLWLLSGKQQAPAKSDLPGKPEAPMMPQRKVELPTTPLQEKQTTSKNIVDAGAFREINKSSGLTKYKTINSLSDLTERELKYLKDLIHRYTTKTKGSQLQAQTQRKHLADPRSISGFNSVWKDMIYQIAANRSQAAKFWDVDGNEYIDYRSSFGISLFGHSPDFIKTAIQDQLDKGFELGVLPPLAKEVADLICELSGMERVTLVNTGSEALSASVRAARTVTGKDKIAVFEGDYHGIADELLVRSLDKNDPTSTLPVAPGIPTSLVDQVIVLHYDDPQVLEKIEAYADELAAVLIEPIQPNEPTKQPRELIQAIRKITAARDIALIFDEMITGFRLGVRGAQEWYDVEVDICAYGKIISGGLPLAAVAGKAKYLDAFDGGQWQFGDDSVPPADVTFFGGTFVRHPLGLASAKAALQAIKDGGPEMYHQLNDKSKKFAHQLMDLFNRTKAPLRVLGTSSIICIRPADKNPFTPLFFKYCVLKGIHLSAKAALITTAHTEEDFAKTLEVIEESIKEMQTAGFFPITVREYTPEHEWVDVPKSGEADAADQAATPSEGIDKHKLPLTEGQKEVWVEHRLGAEAAAAYNLAGKINLKGEIDIEIFAQAIDALLQRHEALRVVFNEDTPTQTLLENIKTPLERADFTALSEEEKTRQIELIEKEQTEIAFDLFNGPLIKFILIKKSQADFVLILNSHHGVADGWSCGILAKELGQIYAQLIKNKSPELPKAKSYVSFILEEADFVTSKDHQENLDYWKSTFVDDIPVLEFPTDRPRPPLKTYDADLSRIHLDQELIDGLKQVAISNGATLFSLLYSSFRVFMHRLSGQDDFVLGLVAAAHTIGGNENLVCHGVSLLPVRNRMEKEATFIDELKVCKELIYDAFDHQQFTLGTLVRALNVKRDASRQPIISHLFNMDAEGEVVDFGTAKGFTQPIQRKYETFDSFINVKALANGIDFEWIFNTDLFDQSTIDWRLQEYKQLLQSILQNPNSPIDQLNIIPQSEKDKLASWQGKKVAIDYQLTLPQLISQQASKTPSATAISGANRSYSYTELEEQSNRIAHRLLQAKIGIGDRVGVYLERSPEVVIALLGILKIGAVYVPIDPVNPVDRCRLLLKDANTKILITQYSLNQRMPSGAWELLWLSGPKADWKNAPSDPTNISFDGNALAYVIYTSGSTGKPKSVSIPHFAIIDHHQGMIEQIGIESTDRIMSVASMAFDPSVQDYFLPLMIGGQVIIASREEQLDGRLLMERIETEGATLMQATPATWKLLLNAGWQGKKDLTILSGGEGLNKALSAHLLNLGKRVFNIYGPTETTIWSTAYEVKPGVDLPSISGYEPVGKPIQNVELLLLDEQLQLAPIGAIGELYIGGPTIAPTGYLGQPELTAYHFVDHPNKPGQKLYRTGDAARYLHSGDLEFLGRRDGQVKIRGHRIELGEIESFLSGYEKIKNQVVVVQPDKNGDASLVAYVIMNNGTPLDQADAQQYLKQQLPNYMVPAHWVELTEFPLTTTLKVDRKKLPQPDWDKKIERKATEISFSEEEVLIKNIWEELLGQNNLSREDNFFDLGGHSLIAVKLMADVENITGKRLPLSSLMEHPVLKDFAGLLSGEKDCSKGGSLVPIRPQGKKKAIYLIHGAGLHVLMYQTLADHMDIDQPIFGFQARGIYGEARPFDRIEDIAHHYIEEIMQRDPEGPYALAGYSFGGLITFEMAKQLEARGKEVVMLGMFDTVVRPEITGEKWSYYQSLNRLGKKVAWNIKALAQDPVQNIKYKSSSLSRRFKRLSWNLRHDAEKEMQNENADHLALVDKMNKIAFENYRLTPYDGKIHIFRAEKRRFWMEDFESLGWSPFAKKGVITHDVPGDHLNLFNMPNGAEFARILQDVLDKVFTGKKV